LILIGLNKGASTNASMEGRVLDPNAIESSDNLYIILACVFIVLTVIICVYIFVARKRSNTKK